MGQTHTHSQMRKPAAGEVVVRLCRSLAPETSSHVKSVRHVPGGCSLAVLLREAGGQHTPARPRADRRGAARPAPGKCAQPRAPRSARTRRSQGNRPAGPPLPENGPLPRLGHAVAVIVTIVWQSSPLVRSASLFTLPGPPKLLRAFPGRPPPRGFAFPRSISPNFGIRGLPLAPSTSAQSRRPREAVPWPRHSRQPRPHTPAPRPV